jgi:type I restriction enzyme, S subunit
LNYTRLSEISIINPTWKDQGVDDNSPCSFIPMEYVDDVFGLVKQSTIKQVGEVKKGYTHFQNGDVLFAKITPCMENGKCAIVSELVNGIGFGSTEFHVVRAGECIKAEWIYYYLRQQKIRNEAVHWMRGTAGQQRVPTDFLSNLEIPLPSLIEQERLVTILQKADRIRRLRRHARQMSETFLQSVFLEMFGKYINDSSPVKFKDVLEIPLANGVFEYNENYGSGAPVIWVDNLYYETPVKLVSLRRANLSEKSIQKYKLEDEDLLFTRSSLVREGIGQINIVRELGEPTLFECHTIRARVKRNIVNPYFVLGLFRSPAGKSEIIKRSNTATMTTISQTDINDLPCPIPPKSLQDKFQELYEKQIKAEKVLSESERQAEHLFQSLLQRAFCI